VKQVCAQIGTAHCKADEEQAIVLFAENEEHVVV
jgi:hypothetical protein